MRDDSESTFADWSADGHSANNEPWHPAWTGLIRQRSRLNDETLSALLLLVLSDTDENQRVAPASRRIVNLLSEMDAHPPGSPGDNAARASVLSRLSAALTGLRAALD